METPEQPAFALGLLDLIDQLLGRRSVAQDFLDGEKQGTQASVERVGRCKFQQRFDPRWALLVAQVHQGQLDLKILLLFRILRCTNPVPQGGVRLVELALNLQELGHRPPSRSALGVPFDGGAGGFDGFGKALRPGRREQSHQLHFSLEGILAFGNRSSQQFLRLGGIVALRGDRRLKDAYLRTLDVGGLQFDQLVPEGVKASPTAGIERRGDKMDTCFDPAQRHIEVFGGGGFQLSRGLHRQSPFPLLHILVDKLGCDCSICRDSLQVSGHFASGQTGLPRPGESLGEHPAKDGIPVLIRSRGTHDLNDADPLIGAIFDANRHGSQVRDSRVRVQHGLRLAEVTEVLVQAFPSIGGALGGSTGLVAGSLGGEAVGGVELDGLGEDGNALAGMLERGERLVGQLGAL